MLRNLPKAVHPPRPGDAVSACLSACQKGEHWLGLRNTCLVRSLVLVGLLGDQPGLLLHIGFKPNTSEAAVEGHAWVTLNGTPLLPQDARMAQDGYQTAQTLSPFH